MDNGGTAACMTSSDTFRRGLATALGAYLMWGLLPLYFKALHAVPPLELVGWRVLFTLPVCLVIVHFRKLWAEVRAVLADGRLMGLLLVSALLIGSNWLIFVFAINSGHVLATSLGYYINPLLNVLLGTAFLGERLTRVQWSAVGIAGTGIALLVAGALGTLAIAVSLALTFGFYGFVRKRAPVGVVAGLSIETAILMVPAAAIVWAGALSDAGSGLAIGGMVTPLLAASGLATAIPLLLFTIAARRLPLSTLGFVQFVAPTISFLLGLFVFGERLDPARLACFMLIWLAIALFSWDIARRARQAPQPG